MPSKAFGLGEKVQWKWMGRFILGEVEEIHVEKITKVIKGKKIVRNGSLENPAYFVKSVAGNFALKLGTENTNLAEWYSCRCIQDVS